MSEAYASTLNISFDVRGGLLMRQIHHWAADLFMAAIFAHMLRIFFTGAYRKPREVNWLIGIVLFTLGMLEGLFGYSLPDDLLSGAGPAHPRGRAAGASRSSAPTCRSSCSAGSSPGTDIIPRLYIIHVLLIPALMLALVTAHLFIMFHQKHTQMPGKGRTDKNVVGAADVPVLHGQDRGVLLLHLRRAGAAVDVRPDQPDLAVRPVQPARRSPPARSPTSTWACWRARCASCPPGSGTSSGTRSPSTCSSLPWCRWASSSPAPRCGRSSSSGSPATRREHHVNDRPRNAPTRTAIGMAVVTFYGVLWLEGANDILADQLRDPAVHAHLDRPVRGLRRPDRRLLGDQADLPRPPAQGRAPARARRGDRHHPAAAQRRVHRGDQAGDEDKRAVLECGRVGAPQLTGPSADADEVPAPEPGARWASCGPARPDRHREHPVEADGHGNGHGDGHGNGHGRPRPSPPASRKAPGPWGRDRSRAARTARTPPLTTAVHAHPPPVVMRHQASYRAAARRGRRCPAPPARTADPRLR